MKQRLFPARATDGLPPGLDFETLDAICRQHAGERIQHCRYVHLSSWKPRGTYRLELTTETGYRWPLIFKNERYSAADIPALCDLPVRPGPPEFAVYQTQSSVLRRFLPGLYFIKEVEPGHHFQYVMEDLGNTFERISVDRHDLITAVHALVEVQEALKPTASTGTPYLIVYDRRYSENLLDYVRSSLEAYRASSTVPAVDEVCRNWQRIVAVHQRDEFYQHGLRAPIHGDYNRSNLYGHQRDLAEVKVVDWEWAGIGLPHADLAALLKRARPDDERAALDVFVRAHGEVDAEGHQRLFRWSQLERRLLDAGYIARQHMASTRQLPWLEKFVAAAAADALRAAEVLSAAPRAPTMA